MNDKTEMRKLINEMNFTHVILEKYDDLDFRKKTNNVSFDDPLSIMLSTQTLNEGLIKTYPIDQTIEYIKKHFGFSDNEIWKETHGGIEKLFIKIPNIGKNYELIEQSVNLCGYFIAITSRKENIKNYQMLTLQCEPKFQDDITQEVCSNNNILIHISPISHLGKISNLGFFPKAKNNMFSYPDCIFLVNGNVNTEGIIRLSKRLYDASNNNGKYAVFLINVSDIPDNVRFYKDPNYENGIYTQQNIPPQAISRIGTINLNDEEPKIEWKKNRVE